MASDDTKKNTNAPVSEDELNRLLSDINSVAEKFKDDILASADEIDSQANLERMKIEKDNISLGDTIKTKKDKFLSDIEDELNS